MSSLGTNGHLGSNFCIKSALLTDDLAKIIAQV